MVDAATGRKAILNGDGQTFAEVRTERLGDGVEASTAAAATVAKTDVAPNQLDL